jgi:NSS family neurotransmitter:Na+ symporter
VQGTEPVENRGNWNSKVGFILAAAGSAVGLGNIWAFPSKVANNGGAAFILVYILCCFMIGFPVMAAEMAIGRKTGKSTVSAFKALSGSNWFFPLVGMWGVLCGFMILAFYNVVAGWTVSYVFAEIFTFTGQTDVAAWFADTGNGWSNAIVSTVFMIATISIVVGGVSGGIEKANKVMMPTLALMLLLLAGYVATLDGAAEGLRVYLIPDFSKITPQLVFAALGQSFFSLSLGMGCMITYGSYLNKKQNIPNSAAWVTSSDFSIAFVAGLLVIPAMYVAQHNGITIFDANGKLIMGGQLVFQTLPALFHTMPNGIGIVVGVSFFTLLSMAALTSTISLLEVSTSYLIDERNWNRKRASITMGLVILVFSLVIAFNPNLIDTIAMIFNDIGLPLGGLFISIFVGYFWTVNVAKGELAEGYPGFENSLFAKIWPLFIKYISPVLIAGVLGASIYQLIP